MPTSLYRRSLASMAPPSVAAISSTNAAGLASAANLSGLDARSRRAWRTPRTVLVAVLVLCVAFAMALATGPTLAADPWSRGEARTGVTVQRGTGVPTVPGAGSCPIFPLSNVWNQRIDRRPVAANSATMISAIGLDRGLHMDFGSYAGYGIPYNVVSA